MKSINIFNNLTLIFIFKLAICSESEEDQSTEDCTMTFSDDEDSFSENKSEPNEIEKVSFVNEDFKNFIFLMKKSFDFYINLEKNNKREQNINNELLSVILCVINKTEIALETQKYEIYFKKASGLVDNFIRLFEKKIKFSKRMFFLILLRKIVLEFKDIVTFLPKLIEFFKEKAKEDKSNSAVFTFFEEKLDYLLTVFNEIISKYDNLNFSIYESHQLFETLLNVVVCNKVVFDEPRKLGFSNENNFVKQRMFVSSTLDFFKVIEPVLTEEYKLLKIIFEDFKKIWKSKFEITDRLKTLKGDA